MKRLMVLFLCVMMISGVTTVFANPSGYDTAKIEQVYSRMPEVKAYMRFNAPVDAKSVSGFVDSEELSLLSLEPFKRDEGISFIFMFDCSTSVTNSQMKAMKETVINFISNDVYANDRFTIVSFGEQINILADGSNTRDEAVYAVDSMKNDQNATVLYDAVNAVRQISESADETYPHKRMCIIFTDAVDYNLGGTTDEEVLKAAETAGTPLYAVAINPNNRDSIDSLGAVARASGGELCIAQKGDIGAAFTEAVAKLNTLYELKFMAKTNKASMAESNLSIFIGAKENGSAVERRFRSSAWIADSEAPRIVSSAIIGDKEIELCFSETVVNAGKAENYSVKKGKEAFKIKAVHYDEKSLRTVITFEEYIGSGEYVVTTSNITDNSMESNALTDPVVFEASGFKAFMANLKNSGKGNGGALIAIVFTLIIALVAYIVVRKRKGVVMLDNKATFGDNVSYKYKSPSSLPTSYIKFVMKKADGDIADIDVNIVQSVIFGRADSCEVTIDDASLSRQHFAIEVEDGALFVQNLSQTNGTLLNGIPLQSKRKLAAGDVISAGQEEFTVVKI